MCKKQQMSWSHADAQYLLRMKPQSSTAVSTATRSIVPPRWPHGHKVFAALLIVAAGALAICALIAAIIAASFAASISPMNALRTA